MNNFFRFFAFFSLLIVAGCLPDKLNRFDLNFSYYGKVSLDSGSIPGSVYSILSDSQFYDLDSTLQKHQLSINQLQSVDIISASLNSSTSGEGAGFAVIDSLNLYFTYNGNKARFAFAGSIDINARSSISLIRDLNSDLSSVFGSDSTFLELEVYLRDTIRNNFSLEMNALLHVSGSLD